MHLVDANDVEDNGTVITESVCLLFSTMLFKSYGLAALGDATEYLRRL